MFRSAADIRAFVALYPLPLAAVALVGGMAAGFCLPEASEAWGAAAGACAAMIAVATGWNVRGLVFPAVFAAGAALAMRADSQLLAVERRLSQPTLQGAPEARFVVLDDVRPDPRRDTADMRAFEFQSRAGPLQIVVSAAVPRGEPFPAVGETWRCKGWLLRPRADRSRFSRRRFSCNPKRGGRAVRAAPADPHSLPVVLRALRRSLSENAGIGLEDDPETASMNRALMLGERSQLDYTRRKTFIDAGTVHVFAISGLHVMLMAALLERLLKLWRARLVPRIAVLIPAVFAYAVLTGARPSAMRAAAMAALYYAAPAIGRRPSAAVAVSIAALAVYGANPQMVFDAGCTLSFTVMIGIAAWCAWARRMPSLWRGLDMRAAALRRAGRIRAGDAVAFVRRRLSNSVSAIAVTAAAWTAGVPPAAAIFGRFTPGGLLSGAPVCLIAFFAILICTLGMAAGYVCRPLAAVLNWTGGLCTRTMAAISEAVAALPFSSLEVRKWTIAECVAWYAAVILAAVAIHFTFFRRNKMDWLEEE